LATTTAINPSIDWSCLSCWSWMCKNFIIWQWNMWNWLAMMTKWLRGKNALTALIKSKHCLKLF